MWILTGGDDQVHLRRQVLEQKGEGIVNRFGIDHVVVVKDEDEIVRDGGDFVEQGRQNRFGGRRLRGLERSQRTPSPIFAAIVCKAATRYVRKRVGSLSPSSSDSQAAGRPHPATHSLTSVVLPKPAGAEIRVSLPCRPSFSRSTRRGRRTTLGRGGGI